MKKLKPRLLNSAGQPMSNVHVTSDSRMVHEEVKKTAQEMAGAYYERAASRDDRWYKLFPDQKAFINSEWQHFVVTARQVLASMLGSSRYDNVTKERVYDILTKDATLPYHPNEEQVFNVH